MPLTETPSASYLQRTEWNVRDSDGAVIFTVAAALAGGSKRTADFAKKHGKPWLHLSECGRALLVESILRNSSHKA